MLSNFDLTVLKNELMMDSRDVAMLTGKRHVHVSRDIARMLEELYGDDFGKSKNGTSYNIKSYRNANNVEATYYLLSYELAITLLTGYSLKLRNAVVKRWIFLEKDYRKKRAKSIEVRNHFTYTLQEHGYDKAHHYIQTTNQMKKSLGIENKKENMSAKEIQAVKASEALAELLLDDEEGYGEVNPVCVDAANIVASAKRKKLTA